MNEETEASRVAMRFMIVVLVRRVGLKKGQTIMPGRTLVAIRTAEQIVARAVARMFMMVVLVFEVWVGRGDQTIAPGTTLTAMKKLEQTTARAAAKSWL
ncbi:hypothetical protein [Blastomonas sp.]|uniref:hypothetical protein n=1 Tax=Blastomonas sp. TaxID=1909299 RepID=UPI002629998A|nr:hypothetical protein [Blastomonas sp.]MDM7957259.1 hypothetical protein [Blastomonas sp.]